MTKKKIILYSSLALLIIAVIALSFYGVANKYSAKHISTRYLDNLLRAKYEQCYDDLSSDVKENTKKEDFIETQKKAYGEEGKSFSNLKIIINGEGLAIFEYYEKPDNKRKVAGVYTTTNGSVFGFIKKHQVTNAYLPTDE